MEWWRCGMGRGESGMKCGWAGGLRKEWEWRRLVEDENEGQPLKVDEIDERRELEKKAEKLAFGKDEMIEKDGRTEWVEKDENGEVGKDEKDGRIEDEMDERAGVAMVVMVVVGQWKDVKILRDQGGKDGGRD